MTRDGQAEDVVPKGRILIIGLEGTAFERIEPLLRRPPFAVDRVRRGESALLLSRHAAFHLLIVRHPLPDIKLRDFLGAARGEGSPCARSHLVVVTEPSRIEEARSQVPGAQDLVLSLDEPRKLFEEVASRLLGVAPRLGTRLMARLAVGLEPTKTLLMCQSENVSETGMLVRTDRLYPVGTWVAFEVSVPAGRTPIQGEAEIVRHTLADVDRVSGLGLKFVTLKGDSLKQLRDFLKNTGPT